MSRCIAGSSGLKRSSDSSTDDRREKRWKGLPQLSEEKLEAMDKVYERINMLSGEPQKYSDPNEVFDLPFPSVNQIPSGFSLLDTGRPRQFSYMGREFFKQVLEVFDVVKGDPYHRQALYLHGCRGVGKSYILAALACLLVRTGTQVVYIPDCHAWLLKPLDYLRKAVLFAFVKSNPSFCEEILNCGDLESLANFCSHDQRIGQLCFIVDQVDALDLEPKKRDVVTDEEKNFIRQILHRMCATHILITSAAANHKAFRYMASRDTGERRVHLKGGMTSSEMTCWWKHHDFAAFSDEDKHEVEDLTGCIPLLLKPFVIHHEETLDSLQPQIWYRDEELASVRGQIFDFANAKNSSYLRRRFMITS